MATITLTIGPNTASKTISAADLTRLNNAMIAYYQPAHPGQVLTGADVFGFWVVDVVADLKARVRAQETATAVATAQAGVTDIGVT